MVNGIVENYKELRAELAARGHEFKSETDAEVVAHLIEEHIGDGLTAAVRATVASLDGHYAFCALSADEPDIVVGTRNECPLVVGVGEDEMFFASAIPAFLAHTSTIVVLEDGDVVTLRADGAEICDVAGRPLVREQTVVPWDDDAAEKGGYETFMLKEIHEQPAALRDTRAGLQREEGGVDLAEEDGDSALCPEQSRDGPRFGPVAQRGHRQRGTDHIQFGSQPPPFHLVNAGRHRQVPQRTHGRVVQNLRVGPGDGEQRRQRTYRHPGLPPQSPAPLGQRRRRPAAGHPEKVGLVEHRDRRPCRRRQGGPVVGIERLHEDIHIDVSVRGADLAGIGHRHPGAAQCPCHRPAAGTGTPDHTHSQGSVHAHRWWQRPAYPASHPAGNCWVSIWSAIGVTGS